MEVKITNESVYREICSLFPAATDQQMKKIDARARICSSCVNFAKINLFCSKCNCQKATEYSNERGKFVREKLLDLSYHCPRNNW
jgi:membrane protease subunit (stomatin/prohibitin family)